ncbi:RhoGEF domain-containing protein [Heterostelium album PN500]|uniref:RhoGEF domain-containing protein n=1 Tax=Heterostelium pallidum (strain ATCC 26659 / Pp 5 / PN500) TaxID=670386 RepID=D3BGU6_HETP5|nr:RhoGEF domain-containing protein [Heterostelium album PN500]EFA79330.1 RhoGEF domain-containing protein [Heterostelium album PN500]|eukprot:XP_020431451.1 RhoGEF domain-containing protein [Heterostelium album PN500]
MSNMNSINDDRVKLFLRTEANVRQWIEESLKVTLKGDLYEKLRSGIVLCYLANAISPDAVPKIQENTNVEFKLHENISFFLEALEEFGTPKHKRFQLADLYEGGNKVKVIESLVSLAEYAVVKYGFHTKMKPIDPKTPVVIPAHEQLKELKYWLSLIKEPTKQMKGGRKGATILKTQMALLAGNTVDFAKCERGFIAFQSLWRGFKCRKLLTKIKRDCAYRDKITQEIFKTEKDYVTNLSICINNYMTPLKELLNKDQIKTIFSDIQIIHAFGQKLIEKLRPRIESWNHRQRLGDIFLEIADFLKVYTGYIQNYNNALAMLDEIRKKDKISHALNECRAHPDCKGFELSAFLITPIQRVPRYNLLLMDLVKHTWADHPDYKSLCDATERIKGIASFLNEKKREGENIKRFTDIQACLEKGPLLFAPTLEDQVGAAATTTTSSTTPLSASSSSSSSSSPLQITLKSNEVVLVFTAKDEEEYKEWVEDLKKTIVDAKEKDNMVKEAKAGHATAKESTQAPAQPEKEVTAEQQLAERRKTKKDLASSTNNANSNNTPQPTITISTSVSLPTSPVTSPIKESPSPATPSSPSITGNNHSNHNSGHGFSFISSILGKSSGSNSSSSSGNSSNSPSSNNKKTQKEEGLAHNSEQVSESVTVESNNSGGNCDSSESSIESSSPVAPSSPTISNKASRPKKKKQQQQHSVDDIDIGVKKSNHEDGGRARAQTRLQKLTGTLAFTRRKKDKEKLEQAAAASASSQSSESNDNNDDHIDNNNNNNNTEITSTTNNDNNNNNNNVIDESTRTLNTSGTNTNSNRKTPPPPVPSRNYTGDATTTTTLTNSGGATPSVLANSGGGGSEQQQKLSFEEIKSNRAELDQSKLETYLTDEEFSRVFNMEQSAFYKLPKWKQDQKKRELKLL